MPADRIDIVGAAQADLPRLYALASRALTFDRFPQAMLGEKLFFNPHPATDVYHTLMAASAGEAVGMLQHVIREATRQAWLGLFAVDERHRRCGIGRQLYDAALSTWRSHGIRTVDVATVPTNYLVPGIDPRYTAAVCFVESAGFASTGARANMRAPLDRDFDTREQEAALSTRGIEVRRAGPGDSERLDRFFAQHFGPGWRAEVQRAMEQQPLALHLAVQDDAIIGFAAHSTMNRQWGNFGPMGTADQARGQGVGRLLLYRCLADLKAAGFTSAVIPWIGPHRFYCRLADAVIERIFWQYRLELSP